MLKKIVRKPTERESFYQELARKDREQERPCTVCREPG
jgi:hypothetical protein